MVLPVKDKRVIDFYDGEFWLPVLFQWRQKMMAATNAKMIENAPISVLVDELGSYGPIVDKSTLVKTYLVCLEPPLVWIIAWHFGQTFLYT